MLEEREELILGFIPNDLLPALSQVEQIHTISHLRKFSIQIQIQDWKRRWLDALASSLVKMEERGVCCTIICADLWAKDDDNRFPGSKAAFEDEGIEWYIRGAIRHDIRTLTVVAAKETDLGERLRSILEKVLHYYASTGEVFDDT
jgi:hypothetical protein